MWPNTFFGRLPVVALVGRYPANKLIGQEPLLRRWVPEGSPTSGRRGTRSADITGYYQAFRPAIPVPRVSYPCITHPFAALLGPEGPFSLDLHALTTPPAFALSQDQTLQSKELILSPFSACTYGRGRVAAFTSNRSRLLNCQRANEALYMWCL